LLKRRINARVSARTSICHSSFLPQMSQNHASAQKNSRGPLRLAD
jgi:hypothetical protein